MPLLIVEGPDRCGKSSLVHVIRDTLRTAKREFYDTNPIWRWCQENRADHINADRCIHRGEHEMLLRLLPELNDRLVICDRLHLSEWVYGSMEAAPVDWVWEWERRLLDRVGRHNIALVFCLPPSNQSAYTAVWDRVNDTGRFKKTEFEMTLKKFEMARINTALPHHTFSVLKNTPPTKEHVSRTRNLGTFLFEQGICP